MWGWLKKRRRRRVAEQPFPAPWEEILQDGLWQYRAMAPSQKTKLRNHARILLQEKYWEGCDGLTLNDDIKLIIAAQAALLTLGMDDYFFPTTPTILVYPDSFEAKRSRRLDAPAAWMSGDADLMGQAWHGGPVIVSWKHARQAGRFRTNHNVVIHEFAHKLDMADGDAGGEPPLRSAAALERWRMVMRSSFNQLRAERYSVRDTILDDYGADDPGEFFAVSAEAFFQRPKQLKERYSELYDLLKDFFVQDPVATWAKGEG